MTRARHQGDRATNHPDPSRSRFARQRGVSTGAERTPAPDEAQAFATASSERSLRLGDAEADGSTTAAATAELAVLVDITTARSRRRPGRPGYPGPVVSSRYLARLESRRLIPVPGRAARAQASPPSAPPPSATGQGDPSRSLPESW
jgi:hypothetical protein